jgi:hypothetical protein
VFTQGDRPTAVRLAQITALPHPYPDSWEQFLDAVRHDYDELTDAVGAVSTRKQTAIDAIEAGAADVEERRAEVQTRTQQLVTLIEQTTSAQAQTFFDAEATKYEEEGRLLWRSAVGILTIAVLFAIAPIAIYYIGAAIERDWLSDQNLVAAHLAPALALGAVAGVLLARARGRDRARQRARDLSVALGTMFVYSGQIADEEERQRFLHEMGRTVLEAFLRQDAPVAEADSGSLFNALMRRS